MPPATRPRAKKSPFLQFTAAEFRQRGTRLRQQLSDKTYVQELLRDKTLGGTTIGLPKQYAKLTSPEQITPEILGERTALKFAHGWSAKGVMLLEKLGENRYFDHMAMRECTLERIREKQQAVAAAFGRKNPVWIVEEFLRGAQPGEVPFDYKFYMFQGQIAMVAQIDRNSSPPKMIKLKGNLTPFTPGKDYWAKPKDLQPAVPVVPRSAVMLSRWAIELSTMTDAPFVRVDLYDTVDGPYFGEFTFSSGAEFKGTVTYSPKMLNRFDQLFGDAQRRLDGEETDLPAGWSTLLQSLDPQVLAEHPQIPLPEYERFSYLLHNHGSVGARRLAEAQKDLLHGAEDDATARRINRYLTQAHKAAGLRAVEQQKKLGSTDSQALKMGRKVYKKAASRIGAPRGPKS
ncbi:ATP-grasp fold amidoligase family protein [Nesterenkonia massiliensis]|uniref:ATP-grasp fold amidoligase family protein n=1 Tax=Nesterenkonia massiliensis TaxID=1232429 RepID=UPI00041E9FC1|nr:ATP-grasp fold amidoligase family protein [Nesterenkonia massiliensis]